MERYCDGEDSMWESWPYKVIFLRSQTKIWANIRWKFWLFFNFHTSWLKTSGVRTKKQSWYDKEESWSRSLKLSWGWLTPSLSVTRVTIESNEQKDIRTTRFDLSSYWFIDRFHSSSLISLRVWNTSKEYMYFQLFPLSSIDVAHRQNCPCR